MSAITVERHEQGPRLFIAGRRSHHGPWGLLLIVAGALAVAHDWRDRRDWFRESV
jgi:hypothetical protein